MKTTVEQISLLTELKNNGIMDPDILEEKLNMLYKKKVNEVHSFTISKPKEGATNQFWSTRVCDDSKPDKRKRIKAKSEEGLYKKLYVFYFGTQKLTLESYFPTWVEHRRSLGLQAKTIKRNIEHWNKYYKSHSIVKKDLKNIDIADIEAFFHTTIGKFSLTPKELSNMKIIMSDMFRRAMVEKLIHYNPFLEVKVVTRGCHPPEKKSDYEKIFFPDEISRLFEALNEDLEMNPSDTDSYAIFLLFKLGLRISEIVAIKLEDINLKRKELHIHRMEATLEDENHKFYTEVVNYTKKKSIHGDRFFTLSDYEIDLFKSVLKVNQSHGYKDNNFVFCDHNGRTTCSAIDARLKKVCRWANIQGKTSHTIRRTVATELYDRYEDIKLVRDYLGHAYESTTWGYIYQSDIKAQQFRKITTLLTNMNGLRGPKGAQ